jgi:hypothetical protein
MMSKTAPERTHTAAGAVSGDPRLARTPGGATMR